MSIDDNPPRVSLRFVAGTLEVRGWQDAALAESAGCVADPRSACDRALAFRYPDIVRALVRKQTPYDDGARAYLELPTGARVHREPRPYQTEALAAWRRTGRGVVVLPTGAGKTELAILAIDDKRRSTLVVAPTLDLVRQWHARLTTVFGGPIGVLGGGEHSVHPITVTTYDSAHIHMEHLGARFGLIVFDECHHLPGESYAHAARMAIAPFRLGLTATPERSDGRESDLATLIGPTVYRKDISELAGEYLSEYQTVRVIVDLDEEERLAYDEARAEYVGFIARNNIAMSQADGWSRFIMMASRSAVGQQALAAYRRQRELAFTAPAKLDYLEALLSQHRDDRMLVFTQDNATCHRVALRFLIPAITHHTRVSERTHVLEKFSEGQYGAICTSKVLNEGVDLPSANVAVVLSGSGSVREHVQRLGRILRKGEGKQALLYELITGGTSEAGTSARRREHEAYR